tara:strand:- start:775 stop:1425 length:651 start_codon:yes stop_codon:yes gene_type:complete
MNITHKHHSIITLILLGIIFIATIFTKVTTVKIIESAGGVKDDTNTDMNLAIRDQFAINRNFYDILIEERKLFTNPSTRKKIVREHKNRKKICKVNQELKNLCQTNCINVDEDTQKKRKCYNYCFDEKGDDIMHKLDCIDTNLINDTASLNNSSLLENNMNLEEQLLNLKNSISKCEAEKSTYENDSEQVVNDSIGNDSEENVINDMYNKFFKSDN